jgi:plasmid stabilization system protein ParE
VKIEVTRRAGRQIAQISEWWREHRVAAPLMFLNEVEKAEALLGQHPDVGVIYATHRTGVIRRILLGDTRYHLYYRHDVERREIVVLAVWSAPRGRPPGF